jgi:hypothetical protein
MHKVVTKADRCREVIADLSQHKKPGPNWIPQTKEAWRRIQSLPPDPTEAQMLAALETLPNWIRLDCHDCDKQVDAVVEFNDEADKDGERPSCFLVCLDCLRSAASDLGKAVGLA